MLSGCVCLCVRVSTVLQEAASCQQGGVKRPEGFEHSRPAKLTVCLDNGMFPSPSPSLYPSPSFPLLKISADRKAPPTPPPLLSAYVHSLSLYLCLPLLAIISPPLFSPSRRIHPPPLLQSNPTAINQLLFSSRGRLVSAPSFLSLFTVYFIHPLHFLSTVISPHVTSSLSCSLPLSSSQVLSL